LLVVTSDRALADYVRRCSARIVGAKEFQRRMDETEASGGAAHRSSTPLSEERNGSVAAKDMDEWMRYFGVSPEDDKE
jgi:hypothetical protein